MCVFQKLESNTDIYDCYRCIQPAKAFDFRTGDLLCANHRMSIYHHNQQQQQSKRAQSIIVDATELINNSTLVDILQHYCPQHDYPLEKYCCQCQQSCCLNAACVGQHAQHAHALIPLSQAYNEQRELIRVLGKCAIFSVRRARNRQKIV